MIRLPLLTLPGNTQRYLREFQQKIDQQIDYALRVAAAKREFSRKNTVRSKTFQKVRETLTQMCSGARRCCYCEDSVADAVEHIYPKDLFPEKVFVWENYLYACGPCNGPKNNRFAIIVPGTDQLIHITRRSNAPVIPPIAGKPALIDPRVENPLDYLELDLLGTFYFNIKTGISDVDRQRAAYTLEILRLNDRDYLVEARRSFYDTYCARLMQYIQCRDNGGSPYQPGFLVAALKRVGHPTVWLEMQRQHTLIPELTILFAQAPEALNW